MKERNGKVFRQIVAVLLCMAFLLPYVPAPIHAVGESATEDTVYVLAGSDFQGTHDSNSDHVTGPVKESIQNILKKTGKNSYDGFLFLGDYSVGNQDRTTAGFPELQSALSGYTFANQFYLQGNHDLPAEEYIVNGKQVLNSTGGYDTTYYGVYCLNWDQYGNAMTEEVAQTTANNLNAWLAGQQVGKKPIFVISHMPLHYSWRTNAHADAQYAKYLVDVLNAAGQRGLNIIFLYGHNHSGSFDWYLGGSTNHVPKGDTLWIANPTDSKLPPVPRGLNFTYMNAGYVGNYAGNDEYGIDDTLTMSVFEITGDDVTIRRYSAAGQHNLQACPGTHDPVMDPNNGYHADTDTCETATAYGNKLDVAVSSIVSTGDFHVGSYASAYVKNPNATSTYSWISEDTDVVSVVDQGNGTAMLCGEGEGTALIRVTETAGLRGTEVTYTEFYVTVHGEVIVDSKGVIYQLAANLAPGNKYVFIDSKHAGAIRTMLKYTSGTTQGHLGNTADRVHMYNGNAPYYIMNGDFPEMRWLVEKTNTEGYFRLVNEKTGTYLQVDNFGDGKYSAGGLKLGNDGQAQLSDKWGYDQSVGLYSNLVHALTQVTEGHFGTEPWIFTYGDTGSSNQHYHGKWWLVSGHYLDSGIFNRVYAYEERPLTASARVSDVDGKVALNAASSTETGSMLVKTWSTGKVEYIPITADMLQGTFNLNVAGVYTNLSVIYNGLTITADYTLTVGDPANTNRATIVVPEGHYYRLTDEFKQGAGFNQEHRYLIVNRNSAGEGKLMESKGYVAGSVKSTAVPVTLDANGIPSVQSKFLSANPVFQEWWYHYHGDAANWFLFQPNWGTGSNNYLRDPWKTGGGPLNSGAYDSYALKASVYRADDASSEYVTIFGILPVAADMVVSIEYVSGEDKFYSVLPTNQTRGQEVYIYEKVSYNTAEISTLSTHGHTTQYAETSAYTGTKLLITYPDGTQKYVDVTVDMLFKNGVQLTKADLSKATTITGLTLKYTDSSNGNGVVVTNAYDLHILPASTEENPDSPNAGHVDLNKYQDTSELNFDETGVARVDLSTHGIPMNSKLDVLVVVDTSSSVGLYMDNGKTRIEAMRDALNELVNTLKQPNTNGSMPDVNMAVYEFNDYTYFTTDNTLLGNDNNGVKHQISSAHPEVAHNGEIMGYTDIYDVPEFTSNELKTHVGTNYDVAMQMAYETVAARKASEAGKDREQVVIFMTDGICYQYNYLSYSETADLSNAWKMWLEGTLDEHGAVNTYVPAGAQAFYNADGKHWMAEAIKGTSPSYTVIWNESDKVTFQKDANNQDVKDAYGQKVLAAPTMAADTIREVPGLGATMFTVSFGISIDGETSARIGEKILTSMASDPSKYYNADDPDELRDVFRDAVINVQKAATNAELVDQMGAAFDLQMGQVTNSKGEVQSFRPTITIKTYDLFKANEVNTTVNGVYVTPQMVGTRKSNVPANILETVSFNEDGTEAYSDRKSGNILNNGIIDAYYFQYNTNKSADPGVEPQAETFVWNIGEITEQELVLSYYVYLENSMGEVKGESGTDAGTYETNTDAVLSYINYQGTECFIEAPKPNLSWKDTTINHAYYLVDSNGKPVDNSGNTVSFTNKEQVGQTTAHEDLELNVDHSVTPDNVPDGYFLYDPNASGSVNVNSGSNCGGEWTLGGDTDTTYITVGDSSSNSKSNESKTGDYNGSTVWFAVVQIYIMPDQVVIDYGLPVDISVLENDFLNGTFELYAVGQYNASLPGEKKTTIDEAKTQIDKGTYNSTYAGSFGTATVNGDKVRYTPGNMEMNSYEKFLYAIKYTGNSGTDYYLYATVIVIPATTIYYEDNFLEYDNLTWQQDGTNWWDGAWTVVESANGSIWKDSGTLENKDQAEDRPGADVNNALGNVDADNIYGYDGAYTNMTTHSLGYARKATVDYNNGAQAAFKFYGTGFDVISMTDTTTGTIFVDVYKVNANGTRGEQVRSVVVDTYYGCERALCHVTYRYVNGGWLKDVGEKAAAGVAESKVNTSDKPADGTERTGVEYCWLVSKDSKAKLYQVPVIEIANLEYGRYEAVIQATYETYLDHIDPSEANGSYDFYLDAIRIYDPADDGARDETGVIEGAYVDDGEGWPSYIEIRNKLIDKDTFKHWPGTNQINGLVFIDGMSSVNDAAISDYVNYGPNNEVYLAAGQSVAFMISCPTNTDRVHIGVKSANGGACNYIVTYVRTNGTVLGAVTKRVSTTTDMYYDITDIPTQNYDIITAKDCVIVITNEANSGSGIISLTNIKSTYTSNTANAEMLAMDEVEETGETYVYMTRSAASAVLAYLNGTTDDNTPEVDDNTGTNTPDQTEPSVPDTDEPNQTEPSVPDADEPDQDVPGIPETGDNMEHYLYGMMLLMLACVAAIAIVTIFGNRYYVAARKERT